jgi:hypothetical protein
MRRTCRYQSLRQATIKNPLLHEADDWEHRWALCHRENRGTTSNHIGEIDWVERGESKRVSPAEMQEGSDDVSLGNVLIWGKQVVCLRGDFVFGKRAAHFFHRHGGMPDVDDAGQEAHLVKSGQGRGALLRGLVPALNGLDGRVAPNRALE